MNRRRARPTLGADLESRVCLSTVGFDHVVAPQPAGHVAPSTYSLSGNLSGTLDGSQSTPRGNTTTHFTFAGSLASPGPVNASVTVTTNKFNRLTTAKVSITNSLGTIRLVSAANDYLGTNQTSSTAAFGALYRVQGGTGSYKRLSGKGTFVITATATTASTPDFQIQFRPQTSTEPAMAPLQ